MKLHSRVYADDYGMLVDGKHPYVHMFDSGVVRLTNTMRPLPVIKVNAMWMDKDVKVSCDVADTDARKKEGLQKYSSLEEFQGLYFPYPGYSDVTFHQGSVKFPLDVMFLRDGCIQSIEENTKVGGADRWTGEGCDGVIEVNGGFCKKHQARVNDRIVFFAFSEQDIKAYEADRLAIKRERLYAERTESLVHSIIGALQ